MPISFGSVGDIISIVLIVKGLVSALNDSRGSASEYREVIRELWSLDRALLEVDLLSRTYKNTIELTALCETAQQAAKNCRLSIEEFAKKIKKYGPALGESTSRNFLRDTAMKIRWVSQKEDIEKFRAQVTAHVHSLNMLLASASVNILQINDRKLNARLIERDDSQDALIIEVRDRLQENNKLISIGNNVATKIAGTLRLDWIHQLTSELKSMMRGIFVTNVATYQAVVGLQARLPSRLERSLDEEPFVLEDAIGRISPVHMRFINSWEAFDAVLELRFRSVPGHKKVKNGEYVIQEHATRREIRRNLPWEASFIPGQRVDMSLIFENRERKVSGQTSCPKCKAPSSQLQDCDIQWNCGMWYRRITEYKDVELPRIPPMAAPRPVHFGQNSFGEASYGPEPPISSNRTTAKRSLRETGLEDTDDVINFKRVRVISKLDRIKSGLGIFAPFSLHATTAGDTAMNVKSKQEAEEQATRKLFETRAAELGMDHPDTHSSLNAFAFCLRNQRKFAAAETLFRVAYDDRKDSLITTDPECFQVTVMNLMVVLADQNKAAEIDELRLAAAAMFKSNMDPETADTFLGRLQVVQILQNQEKQKENEFSEVRIISGAESWQPRDVIKPRYHGSQKYRRIEQQEIQAAEAFLKAVRRKRLSASLDDGSESLSTTSKSSGAADHASNAATCGTGVSLDHIIKPSSSIWSHYSLTQWISKIE